MSKELIKKVIPFDEKDLEMNRQGRVSTTQLQRLRSEVSNLFNYGIGGILISILLFIIAAIWISNVEYKKPLIKNLPELWVGFVVIALIIFGTCLFLVLWSALRSRVYNEQVKVNITEGKVERFTPGVDEHAYQVKVGEAVFYVDEKTHDAFTGDLYRVYFIDSSDILSVEEIN